MRNERSHSIIRTGERVALIGAAVAGVVIAADASSDIFDGPHLHISLGDIGTTPPKGKAAVNSKTVTTSFNARDFCPQTVSVDVGVDVSSERLWKLGGDMVDQDFPVTYKLCGKAGLDLAGVETKTNGAVTAIDVSESNYFPQSVAIDSNNPLFCFTVPNGANLGKIESNVKAFDQDVKDRKVAKCNYGQQTTFLGHGGTIGSLLGSASSGEATAVWATSNQLAELAAQFTPLDHEEQAKVDTRIVNIARSFLSVQYPGAKITIAPPKPLTVVEQLEDNMESASPDMVDSILTHHFTDPNKSTTLNVEFIQNGGSGSISGLPPMTKRERKHLGKFMNQEIKEDISAAS
jgi:hypothetical protein